jgi:predicted Zn-dependent peptidase
MSRIFLSSILLLFYFGLFAQVNPILEVESYQLDNGLTVMLNPDKTAKRVFGAVMVNAGAKHEDPRATGMAHYLEHLLFKGTQTYGTTDYQAEQPYLDSINTLYEMLAATTDERAQSGIQARINQQAVEASKYGLPNEFDKMLKSIGSTGVNAFTNYEMTFYHNSFPSHEIERWLMLYAERFMDPVFRSFQSELEVVYEEKNRAMDDFQRRIYEEASRHMFPNLPYGQWSVLGKVEHLKAPSLIRMYEFYNDHYVAENMSLILTGNFDPAIVKPLIERAFKDLATGKPKAVNLPPLQKIEGEKVIKKRMTPVKAGFIGYQTVGATHPDRIALDVAEYLLSNSSSTGYVDQLMNKGDMIYSGGIPMNYNDAGAIVFFYVPKILVQSLNAAEGMVLEQVEKVRTGDFSDALLASSKNDLIKEFNSSIEDVTSRGIMIGKAFNQSKSWEEQLAYPAKIEAITKEDIMRVAKKYFGEDRMKLISRTGFPKKVKLDKPGFQPVVAEQNQESDFYKQYQAVDPLPFKPRFLNFEKDVERLSFEGGHTIHYAKNPINDFFEMSIRYHTGRLHDPDYIDGAGLMNVAGAGGQSLIELKSSFAALGVDYQFQAFQNYLQIQLSGREEHFEESVALLAGLLSAPQVDEKTKDIYLNRVVADRKVEREDHFTMGRALYNYALYGDASFYLSRKSEKELKAIDARRLVSKFIEATQAYSADVFYSGSEPLEEIQQVLASKLVFTQNENKRPYKELSSQSYPGNAIFFVHQKKAIQSQVFFHVPGSPFEPEQYPYIQGFNGYFADGFSGLVTQEIREYRSLAYATGAAYNRSVLPGGDGKLFAYIGCQGDKTNDAIPVMVDLLKNMPSKPERMEALRRSLQLKVITNFPDFREVPFRIFDYELGGFAADPNQQAYDRYAELEMEDIEAFYHEHIQNKPYVITIYGDKRRIDMDELKRYGEVIELETKDIVNF